MFNRPRKNNQLLLSFLVLWFALLVNQGFADELTLGINSDLIADKLLRYVETREQNDYLKKTYSPTFQADPFGAIVDDLQNQNTEVVLWGMQGIIDEFQRRGCSISQKNLTAMLYYFSPEFRSKTAYQLSLGTEEIYDQEPDRNAAEKACLLFNRCYYPADSFRGDMMTDCRDKMLERYGDGYSRKQRSQDVKLVQLGKDKYWNASLEDSPYDLMYDFSAISKIMFESIQEPAPIFFFSLPTFSSQYGGSSSNTSSSSNPASSSTSSGWGRSSSDSSSSSGRGTSSSDASLPSSSEDTTPAGWWKIENPWAGDDEFTDFLTTHTTDGAFQTSTFSTLFGGNVCMDMSEVEDLQNDPTLPSWDTDAGVLIPVDDDVITDEEYTDYVEDILSQVNTYLEQPDITVTASFTDDADEAFLERPNPTPKSFTPEELTCQAECTADNGLAGLKEAACEIKCCMQKCDDMFQCKDIKCEDLWNPLKALACINEKRNCESQKLACKVMCTCGEWKAPWFDPYKTPGLGPLIVVRFCAVPPTPKEFTQQGKLVMSIEEIFNEIYWVLDTMDKGGELGIFVKQSSYLDSSTKKMVLPKSITFSANTSVQDKAPNNKESDQYVEETLKKTNAELKELLVLQCLDNPVSRNAYLLIQDPTAVGLSTTYSASVDPTNEANKAASLQQLPDLVEEALSATRQDQDVTLSTTVSTYLEGQMKFWMNMEKLMTEMKDTAGKLATK